MVGRGEGSGGKGSGERTGSELSGVVCSPPQIEDGLAREGCGNEFHGDPVLAPAPRSN